MPCPHWALASAPVAAPVRRQCCCRSRPGLLPWPPAWPLMTRNAPPGARAGNSLSDAPLPNGNASTANDELGPTVIRGASCDGSRASPAPATATTSSTKIDAPTPNLRHPICPAMLAASIAAIASATPSAAKPEAAVSAVDVTQGTRENRIGATIERSNKSRAVNTAKPIHSS